jgi:hypothetical protein
MDARCCLVALQIGGPRGTCDNHLRAVRDEGVCLCVCECVCVCACGVHFCSVCVCLACPCLRVWSVCWCLDGTLNMNGRYFNMSWSALPCGCAATCGLVTDCGGAARSPHYRVHDPDAEQRRRPPVSDKAGGESTRHHCRFAVLLPEQQH